MRFFLLQKCKVLLTLQECMSQCCVHLLHWGYKSDSPRTDGGATSRWCWRCPRQQPADSLTSWGLPKYIHIYLSIINTALWWYIIVYDQIYDHKKHRAIRTIFAMVFHRQITSLARTGFPESPYVCRSLAGLESMTITWKDTIDFLICTVQSKLFSPCGRIVYIPLAVISNLTADPQHLIGCILSQSECFYIPESLSASVIYLN